MRLIFIALLGVFLVGALQREALAYLDPGSGSYILMMLISGAVGGAYAIKLYWKKLVGFFSGKSKQSPDADAEDDTPDE